MRRHTPSRIAAQSRLVRDCVHDGWLALVFRYHTWDKRVLAWLLVPTVPVLLLASLLYAAHADRLRAEAERQRRADLTCLARNVYHEARGEPLAGQRAVAEVTLNRVASGRFPDSVCAVVYEQRWDPVRKRRVGAFSWTEITVERQPRGRAWQRAVNVAIEVYDGGPEPVAGGALFYHATSIRPRWAHEKKPAARIGRHIFYL